MKVNDTGLTTTSSVKIESRLRALQLKITSASNTYADFETAYAACTIEIVKQTNFGIQTIITPRKLTDILEIAAAQTGAIMVTSDGSNATVRGGIELSDMGTLEIGNNEFFKINFVGIPIGDTIDIYAIDAQVSAMGWMNIFETVAVDAATPKTILVPNTKMLCLPVATTTRLELNYLNGTVVTLEPEELKAMCYESNELAVNENGVVTGGFRNFYVVNVSDAKFAKVTLSAAGTVVKIDFKQI